MCMVKKPKVKEPKEKDPAIIRNPLLDGLLGNIAAIRNGRNMFRIDLLNPLTIPGGPGAGGGGGGGFGGGSGGGGGGGSSGGGGGGSDGADFIPLCVTDDTLILMADGTEKPAAALTVGDMVATYDEETLTLGSYPVEAVLFASDDVYALPGFPDATARHRFALPLWLARRLPPRLRWFRAGWLGLPLGEKRIAKITISGAHTYLARRPAGGTKWRLSHNVKARGT